MNIKDLEKEIGELVRDLTKTMPEPVAKSYARKRIMEFLDVAFRFVFDETRVKNKKHSYNGADPVSKRIYDCDVFSFNEALTEVKKRQDEFMKG